MKPHHHQTRTTCFLVETRRCTSDTRAQLLHTPHLIWTHRNFFQQTWHSSVYTHQMKWTLKSGLLALKSPFIVIFTHLCFSFGRNIKFLLKCPVINQRSHTSPFASCCFSFILYKQELAADFSLNTCRVDLGSLDKRK